MNNFITIVGFAAATFTTLSFLPQVIRVLKSKETKSLSLSMYIINATGVICWLIYGLLRMDWPVIIANLVTLSLVSIIIAVKLKYK